MFIPPRRYFLPKRIIFIIIYILNGFLFKCYQFGFGIHFELMYMNTFFLTFHHSLSFRLTDYEQYELIFIDLVLKLCQRTRKINRERENKIL
jgi:hypothetical protein